MGRKPDPVRQHFGDVVYDAAGNSTGKRRCNYCQQMVCDAAARLRKHNTSCAKAHRGIGFLNPLNMPGLSRVPAQSSVGSSSVGSSSAKRSLTASSMATSAPTVTALGKKRIVEDGDTVEMSLSSRGRAVFDSCTPDELLNLQRLFARALHRSSLPFSAFDTDDWGRFFSTMRGFWKTPSPEKIAGDLLNEEYAVVMQEVLSAMRGWPTICLTIDGMTNRVSKQVLNLMACGPVAFFLEHFDMSLFKESSTRLLEKLLDQKGRLRHSLYAREVISCENDSESDSSEDADEDPSGMPFLAVNNMAAALDGEPLWALCTDSPNVMKKLRRLSVESHHFQVVFGCMSHCLHNLVKDLLKRGSVGKLVKLAVYIVLSIRSSHLLYRMFGVLCEEKRPPINCSLSLFSPTRWGSIVTMLEKLIAARPVIAMLDYSQHHDPRFREVERLPEAFVTAVSTETWDGFEAMIELLRPICLALRYHEGESASFSSVYATFLSVADGFATLTPQQVGLLGCDDPGELYDLVVHRFKTIYSPSHALAFITDPMFFAMRDRLKSAHGAEWIQLRNGGLIEQARNALPEIAGNDMSLLSLLRQQLAAFLAQRWGPDSVLAEAMQYRPALIWAQIDDHHLSTLASLLVKIHNLVTNAAGGERNHKAAKRVHSATRASLQGASVMKQTAVAFNAKQLLKEISMTRSDDAFVQRLSACGSGSLYSQRAAADEEALNLVFEDEDEDEELVGLSVESVIDPATDIGLDSIIALDAAEDIELFEPMTT